MLTPLVKIFSKDLMGEQSRPLIQQCILNNLVNL